MNHKCIYIETNLQLPLQHPVDLDLHQNLEVPAKEQNRY